MKHTPSKTMVSFKLSRPACRALARVAKARGWTKTLTIEQAVLSLDKATDARPAPYILDGLPGKAVGK